MKLHYYHHPSSDMLSVIANKQHPNPFSILHCPFPNYRLQYSSTLQECNIAYLFQL